MTVFGKSVMTFGLYERKYVAGSIPASQSRAAFVDNVILFPPLGAIDSLAPARSPATLAGMTVYVGGPVPPPFPPPHRF